MFELLKMLYMMFGAREQCAKMNGKSFSLSLFSYAYIAPKRLEWKQLFNDLLLGF
jgi:hypothetical protein